MFEKIAGKKIVQIICGDDRFELTKEEQNIKCFFNGVGVLSSKTADHFGSIIGNLIISSCHSPSTRIKISAQDTNTKYLKDITDTVSKSDQVKIDFLEGKPDEKSESFSIESKINVQALDRYRDEIKGFPICFTNVLALSDVLLKTELPDSAKKFKELDKALSDAKKATDTLSKNSEQYEVAVEQTGNVVGQVISVISNRINRPEITKTAIDHVIANYATMKKLTTSVISSLYPLFDINQSFKKHTGYPATWFFDPSSFYNFTERYKDASDHLIDLARFEAQVIRPLYNWKEKISKE